MLQDLRFALRLLRRSPGFTCAAVLTLAFGIGATTAIFTLVDAVLLRPLDIGASDRVVALQSPQDKSTAFLYAQYKSIRDSVGSTIALAIEYPSDVIVDIPAGRSRRRAAFVNAGYFDVLQRLPRAGRPFVEADDAAGAEPVVILSDTFWRTVFNSDGQAVGRSLRVSGIQMTIVGIAPPRTRGTDVQSPSDIFLPPHAIMRTHTLPGNPGNYFFQDGTPGWSPGAYWRVFGRIAPGVSLRDAEATAVCVVCATQKLQLVSVQSAAVAGRIRGDVSRFSAVLFVAVLLVLTIGCANVAGLVMARTEARRRDIAVRLAMGISRNRLIGQLLLECLLISAAGAVAGIVMGRWILAGLASFELPGFIPLGKIEFPLDARVLAFAIGVSAVSAMAFGLAPARAAARTNIIGSLRQGGRAGRAGRSRYVLIAVQVGLTVVLVFGAALFIRSLRTALGVDIGFDASRVIIADSDVRAARLDTSGKAAYYDTAMRRLQSLPGVEAVSYGEGPFFFAGNSTPSIEVDGQALRLPKNVSEFLAGPGYFRALGIPLVSGRDFAAADGASAQAVVVVNSAFAQRFWPGQSALGHRVGVPPRVKDALIVGVAEDGKYARLDESGRLVVFMVWKQLVATAGRTGLIVRTSGTASMALRSVRDAAVTIDREVPVSSVLPLTDMVSRALLPQQLGFWLLGGFGIIAVFLGVVGIHGLVAFLVAQRTHEIGVRMALGAERGDIMGLMVRGVLSAVLGGAVAGLLVAWWLSAFVGRLLFGVGPHDPAAFAGTIALLVLTAIAGVLVPALRAVRVDPMIALRAE
jgi:predicted permease